MKWNSWWNSFRVRLTLWNVAVLALVLGGFGLTLCVVIQHSMSRNIDQDLLERVHRHWDWERRHRFRGMPGPPGERRPFGPGPMGGTARSVVLPAPWEQRNGFRFRRPGLFPFAGPPPPRPEGPPIAGAQQGLAFDPQAQRRAAFQFPRLFDVQGKPWGGPNPQPPWDSRVLKDGLAGRRRFSIASSAGDRIRVLTAPRYEDGRIVGAVQVARDLRDYDRLWRGQLGTLLALLPLSLLVAGIGGLFLTGRALGPVHEVTQAAAQIGAEDLSRRLKVRGRDELAELAETFNGMIARLESAFEQQRRFTADASHELRTPLARIKVSTSMALADEPSLAEYQTALRIADQAADVMERLIEQLLLLARADAGQLTTERARLDLGCVLHEAIDAVARPGTAPVALDLPPEPIEIDGAADHLRRVFVNLLQNAKRHTPAEGQITLRARADGDQAVVRVTDTGEGIAPEHLPHLGERFYRVDEARARRTGGTGLGLAISRTIVQAHGGHLSIESDVGRGTVVTVSLPLEPSRGQKSG